MGDTAEEADIRSSLIGLASVTIDGETTEARSIQEKILAAEYLDKNAAQKRGGLGIARMSIRPPGSA